MTFPVDFKLKIESLHQITEIPHGTGLTPSIGAAKVYFANAISIYDQNDSNRNIYFIPFFADDIVKVDRDTNAVTRIPHGHGPGNRTWSNAIQILPNKIFYCVPVGTTQDILVYNANNDTFYSVPHGVSGTNYWDCPIFDDNRIIWFTPNISDYVLRIDPDSDQVTPILYRQVPGANSEIIFSDSAYDRDTRKIWMVGARSVASTNYFLKVDTITNALEYVTDPTNQSYVSCKIVGDYVWVFPKFGTGSILKINKNTNAITVIPHGLPYPSISFYKAAYDDAAQKFYLIGGTSNLRTVSIFDIATEQITGTFTSSYKLASIGTIFTGVKFDGRYIWFCPGSYNKFLKFDTITNQFSTHSHKQNKSTDPMSVGIFSEAIIDPRGENIWLIPSYCDNIVKMSLWTDFSSDTVPAADLGNQYLYDITDNYPANYQVQPDTNNSPNAYADILNQDNPGKKQNVILTNSNVSDINFRAVTYTVKCNIFGSIHNYGGWDLAGQNVSVTISNTLSGFTETTNTNLWGNNGYAEFDNLLQQQGGSNTLQPTKARRIYYPTTRNLFIKNDDVVSVTFNTQNYELSGNVTYSGNPLSGVTISVQFDNEGTAFTTTTDINGHYSFTELEVIDGLTVTPSLTGYTFTPQHLTATGNSLTADFTATLSPYTISGTITGPSVSGVLVTLHYTSNGDLTTTTNGLGFYQFTGLTVHDGCMLTPTKPGYEFAPVSIGLIADGTNKTGNDFVESIHYYSVSGQALYKNYDDPQYSTLPSYYKVIDSMTVQLQYTDLTTVTTVTDSNGNFTFTNLNKIDSNVTLSALNEPNSTIAPQVINCNGNNISSLVTRLYPVEKLYVGPYNSANILCLDIGTLTTSTLAHGQGSTTVTNGVIYDGRFVWFAPISSTNIIRLDPRTKTQTYIAKGISDSFSTPVYDPIYQRIYMLAGNANTNGLIYVQLSDQTVHSAPLPDKSGVTATPWAALVNDYTNGDIYLVPNGYNKLGKITGSSFTYSEFTIPYTMVNRAFGNGWFDGTYIWLGPYNNTYLLKMLTASPNTMTQIALTADFPGSANSDGLGGGVKVGGYYSYSGGQYLIFIPTIGCHYFEKVNMATNVISRSVINGYYAIYTHPYHMPVGKDNTTIWFPPGANGTAITSITNETSNSVSTGSPTTTYLAGAYVY